MAPTAALAIEHAEKSSPPVFNLTRLPDGKSAAPVTILSPYEFPVEGQPNSNLMLQLRWYLEQFLDYPFEPEIGHADRVLDALKAWGTQAFTALFDRRDAANWLAPPGILQVHTDHPQILSCPWHPLFHPTPIYAPHHPRLPRPLNLL